jgi:hypothetical protein
MAGLQIAGARGHLATGVHVSRGSYSADAVAIQALLFGLTSGSGFFQKHKLPLNGALVLEYQTFFLRQHR